MATARRACPPDSNAPNGRFWMGKSVSGALADSTQLRRAGSCVSSMEQAPDLVERLREGARAEGAREAARRLHPLDVQEMLAPPETALAELEVPLQLVLEQAGR